jgi:hypothetical protein
LRRGTRRPATLAVRRRPGRSPRCRRAGATARGRAHSLARLLAGRFGPGGESPHVTQPDHDCHWLSPIGQNPGCPARWHAAYQFAPRITPPDAARWYNHFPKPGQRRGAAIASLPRNPP